MARQGKFKTIKSINIVQDMLIQKLNSKSNLKRDRTKLVIEKNKYNTLIYNLSIYIHKLDDEIEILLSKYNKIYNKKDTP